MNRTSIHNAVTAVFAMHLVTDIKNLVPTSQFEFGLFADQDIKVLMSTLWTKRSELVNLMYVEDTPVHGQPAEGSLETNDTGRGDENEEERAEAVKVVIHEIAVITRRIKSLEMQAGEETEEAGKKTKDGARFRFNLKNRQFKSYLDTMGEWLIKRKAEVKPGSYLTKLEMVEAMIEDSEGRYSSIEVFSDDCTHYDNITVGAGEISTVTAQTAIDEFKDLADDEFLTKVSIKAWDRLIERLELAGEDIIKHTQFMALFNARTEDERKDLKTEVSEENKDYKSTMRNHDWWFKNVLLQPLSLLAHTGCPTYLINSPEWRTEDAKLKAADALAKVAEINATMAETNANIALFDANEKLMEMNDLLAKQQAIMASRMAKYTTPVAAPIIAPVVDVIPVEPPKPQAKAPVTTRAPRIAPNRNSAAGGKFATH